ncbi:MAG: hypothetical protein JSU08_08375 [Acidobacteria bacterium]|nr:hypothetical protein [Acidobacteriota bacterium]
MVAMLAVLLAVGAPRQAAAADQVYFSAVDDVAAQLVQRINAETVRIDMSAWYLTDSSVYNALLNRFKAGVQVRLIGDRGSIFEIDQNTKNTFYYLASQGVPIRLRYNPTWYPEIDHWKATIFAGQNLVAFGSANYTPFELTPFSSSNYKDEITLFTTDSTLVNAFKTKFDRFWNDTTSEPESLIPSPPYFKNWDDACASEAACSDYRTKYPNPVPMVINTSRLEPDYPMPSDMVWGQGPSFNNRLVDEINKESTAIDFVIYRLTVDNITNALLARKAAGVPIRLIIEPDEYLNRKWPEFWITHANVDKLWAAGIPVKMRTHTGLTHMKVLITSAIATIASSNYAAAWQRDHDYFMPASAKPTIYTAIKDRFQAMWNDASGFADFRPQGPDAPSPVSPSSGSSGVSTTPVLTWNRAVFATSYDVYLGTNANSLPLVGNVPAQIVNDPPDTYSFTPSSPLTGNATYYWKVVARTNATPREPSMVASSSLQSFTTGAGSGGGGALPTPWVSQDVGSVGLSGSASYANGVFTVVGAGADIWGSADAFRYVYQSVNGDADLIVRVASVQNTNSYAKAGVMLRESTAPGAAHVILDVRPDGSVEFMTRTATGGQTTYLAGASQPTPTWLKLSRSGNTVTGSVSSNGSAWSTVGSTTTSMSASALFGFLVNSHTTAARDTSTFDNVSLSTNGAPPPPPPPPSLPSPWANQDVGSTGLGGNANYSNGAFTVSGAGADVWGSSDAFQYVYQPTNGDVEIVARVMAIQNTHQWAKAGVMLRQALTASSPHVLLDITPGGTVEFMTRASNGAATTLITYGSQSAPGWLKLSRSGSTVTASVSANGSTWTTLGSTTTSIPASAYVGLAVTSHDVNVLNTSTFDNVSVTTGGTPPPPPPPPPTATDVVIYAADIAADALHGGWTSATDPASPSSVKLVTPDNGVANTNSPLASPTDYVDVTFSAGANTPYTIWLRLKATANSKYNDAVWVQFSDALANGAPAYAMNSTSGLLVNLATDSTGSSLNGWGWQNTAYWLSQPTTVTFANAGQHTLRIQIREDGVQFDQIVLSPSTYLSRSPGAVTNDSTIVSKP